MRWEATSFGRPVLAIVLVISMSVFPTVFLPSTPSMWLTGIIFGYRLGLLIIMVGTGIGMSIPYWIGSLFLHRIHVIFIISISLITSCLHMIVCAEF